MVGQTFVLYVPIFPRVSFDAPLNYFNNKNVFINNKNIGRTLEKDVLVRFMSLFALEQIIHLCCSENHRIL